MSQGIQHHIMHALGHTIHKEREKGNTETANALGLIGLGIVLLPVPFIGIPLLIWGGVKAFQGSQEPKA